MALLDDVGSPEELRRVDIPAGRFKGIMISCKKDAYHDDHKIREWQGKRYCRWLFRIDDADAPEGVNGQLVTQETIYERGMGDKWLLFVEELGLDPELFEPEDVNSIAIHAHVTAKQYQYQGETRVRNGIGRLVNE